MLTPRNVFVVSDHGMGRYDGHGFWLNTNLTEVGYVETTTESKGNAVLGSHQVGCTQAG